VQIHRIDIVRWQDAELVIDVACSKGTYIRTLAEDLGQALGCGAHLSALRRTGSGQLGLEAAITLEDLQALSEAERDARLLPPDVLVAGWPAVDLQDDEAGRFLTGLRRRVRGGRRARGAGLSPPARTPRRAACLSGHRPHHRRRTDRRPPAEPH
jgi:tRNA pseudouridine55 synthase